MTYLHKLQIGNVTTPHNVFLGPMAGVSDLPFRLLCKECGAGLVSTEMISAKAVTYRNERTWELMVSRKEERPLALQLFGHEPEIMAEAIRLLREKEIPYDILDINMGCPMPKIVNNGEGSALMKTPALIEEIVRACVNAMSDRGSGTLSGLAAVTAFTAEEPDSVPDPLSDSRTAPLSPPVTVKLRSGFDAAHINAVECALAAEAGGAAAVTVHARTREQYYAGCADYTVIAAVKKAVHIPVIGSGDVTDAKSARRLFDETGCDGIMIARAAQGNPWIFREVCAALSGQEIPPRPSDEEMCDTVLRHARMLAEVKGEAIAVREMRKHLAWYTTGRRGSARLRAQMNTLNDLATLEQMCQNIFDKRS